jgi:DNA-directed RNA polymerase specialized sigma24 family protein
MDKHILDQYIDACALVQETEKEIGKIKKHRKTVEIDSVKGSMHDFPYAPKKFQIEGIGYDTVANPGELDRQERILEERRTAAAELKVQVEQWLNTAPLRMQRIIKYAVFEQLSWGEVAAKMGRKATADSVRMEFVRFIEKN